MRRDYLPDVQPVLWQVAVETCTTFDEMQGQTVETFRALHGPMGLLAQQDAASAWDWPLTDGLGSIRAVLDDAGNPLHALHYAPYGEPFEATGTPQLPHGFTGEPTDANGLLYLRARYYVPGLGVFPSLDPVEGTAYRPMTLNRYLYVQANVVNAIDPMGLADCSPDSGAMNHPALSASVAQRRVGEMIEAYKVEYLEAAKGRWREMKARLVHRMAATGRCNRLLREDSLLPQNASEFAAQMVAISGAANVSAWATSLDTVLYLSEPDLMLEGLAVNTAFEIINGTFDIIREPSLGPLELRRGEYLRLMMGAKPEAWQKDNNVIEFGFINPIDGIRYQGSMDSRPELVGIKEAMQLLADWRHYVSPAYWDQKIRRRLGASIPYVESPPLLAEMTAARYLAFLLRWVDIRNERLDESKVWYYMDDPNAFAFRQASVGYAGEAASALSPNDPLVEEDPITKEKVTKKSAAREQFERQTLGYVLYLKFARAVFGSFERDCPRFVDKFLV